MPRVVALYRYPVKGFTPERCDRVTVQRDGRIVGDRVLAFRFAQAALPEQRDGLDYWPKAQGLALQDFPALASLRLTYDSTEQRVTVRRDDTIMVSAGLDDAGRQRLVDVVTEFLLGTREAKRLQRTGRLPLELVGDGVHARFQDREQGYVSLHGRASVLALSSVIDRPADGTGSAGAAEPQVDSGSGPAADVALDDRRFRSNIVIEGIAAWEELGWHGRVRIGGLEFRVAEPIVRCLATHANPDTGDRDARVLITLTQRIGQEEPTLGTLLLPAALPAPVRAGTEHGSAPWGDIEVGDPVELLGSAT
ncbi:MOSC domain-containing protein [Leucobacter sp. USCH14]|uniref:MOSC domain-containing protein n=1 Tax=Leucobacter sp. USCH14 TaxID=3024838 RepID=UPI003095CEEC